MKRDNSFQTLQINISRVLAICQQRMTTSIISESVGIANILGWKFNTNSPTPSAYSLTGSIEPDGYIKKC